MDMTRPVHLLPRGAEVEEIVNVVAIAVVDARETELVTMMPEIAKSVAQTDQSQSAVLTGIFWWRTVTV